MSIPVWPAPSFPQSPNVGTTEQSMPNTIRTQMDDGLPRARQRSSVIIRNYQCDFILSSTDYATFRDFYENDCNGGAQPFSWNEPSTGTPGTFRFVSVNPATSLAPDLWKVTFIMESVPNA